MQKICKIKGLWEEEIEQSSEKREVYLKLKEFV